MRERQQAQLEHLQRLVARRHRVVVALHQAARIDRAPGVGQIAHRLRHVAIARGRQVRVADLEAVERRAAQHVEDQHAVMRGDRAAGFADDHRMFDAALVADARDAVDHVVGVFDQRVVHRRGEVRAAAVVVDAEAAADVDVLQARAQLLELGIDMRQLVDGFLDAADVLQLAAGMAVHELQAVEHVALAQHLQHLEDLGGEQPELRAVAGRFAPAPRAFARELHAHADARPHAVGLRVPQDQRQLGEVLDHRDDGAAELGREDHRLDVAGVLEAVADDQPVGRILGHRHHGQQLGLASPPRGRSRIPCRSDRPLRPPGAAGSP